MNTKKVQLFVHKDLAFKISRQKNRMSKVHVKNKNIRNKKPHIGSRNTRKKVPNYTCGNQ